MSNTSIPTKHQESYEALMAEKKALNGKVRRAVVAIVVFIVINLGSGLIQFSGQEGPIRSFILGYALVLNISLGICAYLVGIRPKPALTAAIVVLAVAHIVVTLINPISFLTTLPLKAIVAVLLLMARDAVDRIDMVDFEIEQIQKDQA